MNNSGGVKHNYSKNRIAKCHTVDSGAGRRLCALWLSAVEIRGFTVGGDDLYNSAVAKAAAICVCVCGLCG